MRILNFTDAHGTMQKPEGRLDDYPVTFLTKMTEIKLACAHFRPDMVICTGDLFHIPRVSDRFAGMVAEIIKGFGVPTYIVPGNHDMEAYNMNTLSTTKLGLLAKAGVFTLLTRNNPIFVTDAAGIKIAISGQEYYAEIDKGNPNDFMMQHPQSDMADINILAAHAYVTPDPQHPNIACSLIENINTDANIVLSGHYHRQFEVEREDGVSFYNPGSALRVAQTDYNKNHMPKYAILDITLDSNDDVVYDYQTIPFMTAKPGTDIFDYTKQQTNKASITTLTGFKDSLQQSVAQTFSTPSMATQDLVRAICSKPEITTTYGVDIEKKVSAAIANALTNDKSNLSLPSGYVVDSKKKFIRKIEIHNFEAHKDTAIELCDGLNIFGGTSNGGKSSIFRAILWVTDNDPSGSNFITTGFTECWVKITYSDGSYIKRSRTDKSSGEYEVGYIDLATGQPIMDNAGQPMVQIFKGFGSNVPLEVMNVHQMPKVYLTKEMNVHLNVTNQIDNAFLINESPLQKAAAIGRITGTHIIDAAISEENKKILSNSKSIKQYENDMKEWQQDLASMPDIPAMEAKANALKQKKDQLDNLLLKLKNCDDLRQRIDSTNQSLNDLNIQLVKKESMVLKKNDLEVKTKELVQKIDIFSQMQENNSQYLECCMAEDRLIFEKSKRDSIIKYKPSLNKVHTLLTSLESMNVFESLFEKTNSDLLIMKKELTNKSYPDNTEELLKETVNKIVTCINYYDFFKNVDSLNIMIEDMESDLEKSKSDAKTYRKQIDIMEQELANEIIQQYKTCPCCGSEVTKAMAGHMIESYKKGEWNIC